MNKRADEVQPGEYVVVDLSRTFEADPARCKVISVGHVTTYHEAPMPPTLRVEFVFAPVDGDGLYRFGYAPDDQLPMNQETENGK